MHFKTSITNLKNGQEIIRGVPLQKLIKQASFVETIWLILTGKKIKNQKEKIMLEALLVAAIDHGPGTASALTARISTSAKNPTHVALAAGILGFGERHGMAVEGAMEFFAERTKNKEQNEIFLAKEITKLKEDKVRIPGFGHKILAHDSRVDALFSVAKSTGFFLEHCQLALQVEKVLKKISSKPVPLNIDGAMAAVLCDLKVDAALGPAFFLISRVPGLLAHIYEEQKSDAGLRRLEENEVEFV